MDLDTIPIVITEYSTLQLKVCILSVAMFMDSENLPTNIRRYSQFLRYTQLLPTPDPINSQSRTFHI